MTKNVEIIFKGLWHQMPLSRQDCLRFFESVCAHQKILSIAFELTIVDDNDIKLLNEQYLQSPSPTNVLSFPDILEENEETAFLGSLVLSFETLNRESFLYSQPKEDYAKQLLIHGFAHLLGFDHSPKMDLFCVQSLQAAERIHENRSF